MNLLINDNALLLWQETIKSAEEKCEVRLKQELEVYLIALLERYTTQPDIAKSIIATAFLTANQTSAHERQHSLQIIGDQCLIYAGLFPALAKHKLVNLSYFVNIGRSAYHLISTHTNDLYGLLAYDFVLLMDVLQCIRPDHHLMPIEAYERWQELGSKRALRLLNEYTRSRFV